MTIRAARKAMGITQAELAKMTGVSRMNIQRYETGYRQPILENAIAISKALSIPIESMIRTLETTKNTA